MPTIGEILTDVDNRLPNQFTSAIKVGWANDIIRQIFKYMNKSKVYVFTTVKDQPTYALPSDGTIDLVYALKVANTTPTTTSTQFITYDYAGLEQNLTGNQYYDGLSNNVGLFPTPTASSYEVRIFYKVRPTTLSESSLTVVPNINEDYHDIIKFYILMTIAKSGHNPDVQLANNYQLDYDECMARMFKDEMEKKIRTPLKNSANRWW